MQQLQFSFLPRITAVTLAIGLSIPIAFQAKNADAVDAQSDTGNTTNEKVINTLVTKNGKSKGNTKAVFNFHPPDTQESPFNKDTATRTVNPNPITLNYSSLETHGTKGSVTFKMLIEEISLPDSRKGFFNRTQVTPSIQPGKSEPPLNVSVIGGVQDPFTFSDLNPEASFEFVEQGLEQSFSLFQGTAFPELFSPDNESPGAIADGTKMFFRGRIAPGFIPDPDNFWDNNPSGAIDLYTLTITSDINHVIDAQLSFGSSNSAFILDFKDQQGQVFNPSDPNAVNSIEDIIEMAFVNGVVESDLVNIFTVGFTPTQSTSEFSSGIENVVDLAAVETPEKVPESNSVTGLFALGTLGAASTLKRKLKHKPTEKDTTKVG